MRDFSGLRLRVSGYCPICGNPLQFGYKIPGFYSWRQAYAVYNWGTYWAFCKSSLCDLILLFSIEREDP